MELKICAKCILDTTVPEIVFDENGVCNYCKLNDMLMSEYPSGFEGSAKLENIIHKIKKDGVGKRYDCIVGVSGGTDSTYTLYYLTQIGLRPLAVHFDNGWNSNIAVKNIKNATQLLGIDLYTHVADWEEFKDLQIAFLNASTPDAEIPTDYVIISVLLQVAYREGIKYVIEGQSTRAEGTTPLGWTYHDNRYLRDVHRKFGGKKITSFPILSISTLFLYFFLKRIKIVRPLEYIQYSKSMAKDIIAKELNWIDTGGHHHESIFTKFFQSYYLVKKFNIDKRKREFSARIRFGYMTREQALFEIASPYPHEKEIVEYTIKKLGLSKADFEKIMKNPAKSFLHYKSYYPLIQILRIPILLACKLHILPPIFALKYGVNYAPQIKRYWDLYNKTCSRG